MKTILISLIIFLVSIKTFSQQFVSGKISDEKGLAIVGANVYIKDTYFGSTTDSFGIYKFEFDTNDTGVLVVSFIGYKQFEQQINKTASKTIDIVLEESSTNINAVTITAGSFDASDEKKAVTLRPLDIVTTPSAQADIYGALNTMPGTTRVGEDGGLFVRGGEGYEAKTYIDGMLVQSPYSSTMPDVPTRGRFSPFLFSGTVFSTGGYSAEYGQALSSALVLKTNALPEKDVTSIMLMSIGAGASHTKRWDNTSIAIEANYANLYPYFQLVKQDIDWKKAPESFGGTLLFRQKTSKSGMIKSFLSYSHDNSALNYLNYEMAAQQLIKLKNDNIYFNTVYNEMLSKNWQMMSGVSYTYDNETIGIDKDQVSTSLNDYHFRLKLTNSINEDITIKFGTEIIHSNYLQDYHVFDTDVNYKTEFSDLIWATFAEAEIKVSSKFAAKLGGRVEYTNLNNDFKVVPRLSLARKLTTSSQVSIAYGIFHQSAQDDYRKFNNELAPEQASHYILNYQYAKNERTFRVEAYYKDYDQLVKFETLNLPIKESYNNKGYGYAKGIDVFWRDRTSLRNSDYYISYSYIDTERDYKDYQIAAPPIYASKHNLSVVYKAWINKITTMVGASYSVSSGRPYYNPNNPVFMADRTKPYQDLSISASHLTTFMRKQAIIHLSVSNLLGFDNVYSYQYGPEPNENMEYEAYPVKAGAKRFIVFVFMLSLK